MRLYLAAPFAKQKEMRDVAELLEKEGHIVSSTWHHANQRRA